MEFIILGALLIVVFVLIFICYKNRNMQNEAALPEFNANYKNKTEHPFHEALHHFIHNLKSPLSTALLAVDNLKVMIDRQYDKNEIYEVLNEATLSLEETNRKIQELTLLTRQPTPHDKLLNLNDVISSILFSNKVFADIIKSTSIEIPKILVDEQAFYLALEKLIQISMKYKNTDSKLHIDLGLKKVQNSDNQENRSIQFKLYTQNCHSQEVLSTFELKEPELDDKTDLSFIIHFLFNNAALLTGGMTTNGNIYWNILFTEHGKRN